MTRTHETIYAAISMARRIGEVNGRVQRIQSGSRLIGPFVEGSLSHGLGIPRVVSLPYNQSTVLRTFGGPRDMRNKYIGSDQCDGGGE